MDPGTVLLGKYRIEELLGVGGMGRVVRATHLYLNQSVAIKILLPEMAETQSRERFMREAQATVRLRSEHIARVMDVATLHDGTPLMVMEYLEGNDLNQILRHHGPQSPAIVCDLMLQACEGIAEAHAHGIIHRDIKPSNFYITRRPDGSMLLKILDFGISKTPIGYTELTGTESVIGTPTYMAPEQMRNSRDIDARCDVWSIGVVMYQLLCGRPPFVGEGYADLVLRVAHEPPAPLHVQLPPGLDGVIFKCLEKDVAQRFQNVGELARMLAPYASDPMSAGATATRTSRILQQRFSNPNMATTDASGRHAIPGTPLPHAPLSPALLTPKSWNASQTNPTSVSGGAGQQITHGSTTHVTVASRGGRGWLVAGVASLCILAGAGGYVASRVMADDNKQVAPATAAPPSPSPEAPTAIAPTPPPPPTPPDDKAAAKPDDKAAAKPAEDDAPKSTTKPADKPVAKPTTKPADKPTTKPTTKPVAKSTTATTTKPTKPTTKPTTKPSGGDLFDTRK